MVSNRDRGRKLGPVNAYLDSDWDGAWVQCPKCGLENGVVWAGNKKCSTCGVEFLVENGPFVKIRPKDKY